MNKFLFLCVFILSFPAMAAVSMSKPIHYGADTNQIVQIYQPDSCKGKICPVVMWVHGGGWKNGDTTNGRAAKMLTTWANQGIVMVGVNYRLTPDVMHPEHVKDVAAAINWVHQNIKGYGGDAKRISLLGHSAGAHLVALVATNPTYLKPYKLAPKDLANVFPIDTASFDLTKPSRFVGRMVKEAFGTDEVVLKEASPIWNVEVGGEYPAFIIAAAKVRDDAVLTSQILQKRLREAGAPVQLMIRDYPKMGALKAHGAIAQELGQLDSTMTQALIESVLANE